MFPVEKGFSISNSMEKFRFKYMDKRKISNRVEIEMVFRKPLQSMFGIKCW